MVMPAEYRIEYSIERSTDGETFTEVGFGSSGTWDSIDAASYSMTSAIANQEWETTPGMPDAETLEGGER